MERQLQELARQRALSHRPQQSSTEPIEQAEPSIDVSAITKERDELRSAVMALEAHLAQTEQTHHAEMNALRESYIQEMTQMDEQHASTMSKCQDNIQRLTAQLDTITLRLRQAETQRDALQQRVMELQSRAPFVKTDMQAHVTRLLNEQRDAISRAAQLAAHNSQDNGTLLYLYVNVFCMYISIIY